MNAGPEEARDLVLDAFRRARAAGKPDWYRMRSAVLKNRLLDMTGRRFRERDFGVERFSDFLALVGGLVSVDTNTTPAIIELTAIGLDAVGGGAVDKPARERFGRVRPDLWNAAVDYTTSDAWWWNRTRGEAEPQPDPADTNAELWMPTMTPAELAQLRHRFADEQRASLSEQESLVELEQWATKGLGTGGLPPSLRPAWNAYLTANVVERLEAWFRAHNLEIPTDLLTASPTPTRREPGTELVALRRLIISCVEKMTLEELRALPLPASTELRAKQ